jgi:hypothetical protein
MTTRPNACPRAGNAVASGATRDARDARRRAVAVLEDRERARRGAALGEARERVDRVAGEVAEEVRLPVAADAVGRRRAERLLHGEVRHPGHEVGERGARPIR